MYDIWVWKIILRLLLNLRSASLPKKLADNIFINCGGQTDFAALAVATKDRGPRKEGCTGVVNVISKFLSLQEPFFKTLEYLCISGSVLYGTWLVRNKVSAPWDSNMYLGFEGTKRLG